MWWIWLLAALVALVIEIVGSGLIFGGLALAALAAAITSAFLTGVLPGAIVFAVVSVGYLIGLRPTALRLLTGQSGLRLGSSSGPKALIGRRAVVHRQITPLAGQIRLGQGEFWSARPYDGKDVIPKGSTVEILHVEGLTALVAREESS
jgi:membrane protein implicated in regulation of membrane protease activity